MPTITATAFVPSTLPTLTQWIRTVETTASDIVRIPASWTVGTTTNSSVTPDPWIVWNQTITSTTSSAVWTEWVETTDSTLQPLSRYLPPAPRVPTEQEAAAIRAESERIRAEMHEHRARFEGERQLARQKAAALLAAALDDRQRVDLASKGFFDLTVHGKTGEAKRYRIYRGRAGNVRRLDEGGREVRRYCIHPQIDCPDEDTMLTQKLWLEHQEELFLRTANAS